jgi:hypothetical protein
LGCAAAAAVLISSAPRRLHCGRDRGGWQGPDLARAIRAADHGRTYDEQRFSPLEQINTGNVKDLTRVVRGPGYGARPGSHAAGD